MPPIEIQIRDKTFVAQNKESYGIRVVGTNLGITYTGTENGGRVVFAQRTNLLNLEHKYNYKDPVIVNKGDKPIVEEIECRSICGELKIITAKISAI